ncbi:PREDICTED: olfactory receptor 13G1-like [Nanorana parkeri]|uniref:olfactory receptor 13G1-like n=1 Tax=Nanorana parkeri TaxID=125878 RepID=UPI0008545EA3|nr:PREDICTED: olfactory receptor 13G1-like [Nanorana parkeri]
MNQTSSMQFLLLGLSHYPSLQPLFFTIFLLIYIMALVGNVLISVVISSDPRLHTPMYFFLINLSILDICCTTAAIPKMLQILVIDKKSISYSGCISQLYLFTAALSTELILLTVMAYDRYVAICFPLQYKTIMSRTVCICLAGSAWVLGSVNSMTHTCLILKLRFREQNIIDHFFCEIPPVLKLANSDTYVNDVVIVASDVLLGMICFILTVISYTYIIFTIMKIHSAEKKKKAFSTCASHLTVVTIFYGGVIYTYVRPAFSNQLEADKVVSALYAIASPVLNPIIYSLRNKEVINAINKMFCKKTVFQK